jgi:integrase/recombinase XerD
MGVEEVKPREESHTQGVKDSVLVDNYLKDCTLRGYSPETNRTHGSKLRIITEYLGGRGKTFLDVDKFTLRDILDYLRNERRISFKTQKGYFSALSSFYKYLNYEEIHPVNPVPAFKRHYLRRYKNNYTKQEYKLITVEEMAMLINSVLSVRDKAILTLLAKTGIRRGELISVDVDDVDFEARNIRLKDKRKRSNKVVFFDDETAIILSRWLRARNEWVKNGEVKALFVGEHGERLRRNGVYYLVRGHAERVGLDDPDSEKLEDHFTTHCFRHWFTTHMRRNGMPREFIKELRGDSRGEAIDIYDHIDRDELRREYLAAVPRLGIA